VTTTAAYAIELDQSINNNRSIRIILSFALIVVCASGRVGRSLSFGRFFVVFAVFEIVYIKRLVTLSNL